jgi:hypothetical protein
MWTMMILPAPPPAIPQTRHDGWTPERQRGFIAALADCGSVAEAAARAGMSRQAAYALRRSPAAMDFRAAWDAAITEAWRRVEETALERAMAGETEVWERDGVVTTRQRPCAPHLLIQLLDRADRLHAAERARADQEAASSLAVRMYRIRDDIIALGRAGPGDDTADGSDDDSAETPVAEPPADGETLLLRRFAAVLADFVDRSDDGQNGVTKNPPDVSTLSTSSGGEGGVSGGKPPLSRLRERRLARQRGG